MVQFQTIQNAPGNHLFSCYNLLVPVRRDFRAHQNHRPRLLRFGFPGHQRLLVSDRRDFRGHQNHRPRLLRFRFPGHQHRPWSLRLLSSRPLPWRTSAHTPSPGTKIGRIRRPFSTVHAAVFCRATKALPSHCTYEGPSYAGLRRLRSLGHLDSDRLAIAAKILQRC